MTTYSRALGALAPITVFITHCRSVQTQDIAPAENPCPAREHAVTSTRLKRLIGITPDTISPGQPGEITADVVGRENRILSLMAELRSLPATIR